MPLQATSGAASYDAFGGGVAVVPTYIEDVFSTWLYTGTGAALTITNNIDLSTKGGLTWIKGRSGATGHRLTDTARGVTKSLESNSTAAEATESTGLTAFGTTGFTIGADADYNTSAATFVSWTFREQPKFFDIVTYTGTGSNRTIAHNLGSVPGCIIVKVSSSSGDNWYVYHRSLATNQAVALNSTAAVDTSATFWNNTAATSTEFSVGTSGDTNGNGKTFIAYLFAHDAGGFGLTGTDNVISCGSFTTDGSGNATVSLGYEPQWLLTKSTNLVDQWYMLDSMRGWPVTTASTKILASNTSGAETTGTFGNPTATGFTIANGGATKTYIYIAIRRGPMKVPTTGTSVFAPITYAGTNTAGQVISGANFPPDLSIPFSRAGAGGAVSQFIDRLRGGTAYLPPSSTAAEGNTAGYYIRSFNMDGVTYGTAYLDYTNSAYNYVNWMFRRAPSFMDVVCYTGTGSAGLNVSHNLSVVPELMIVKCRNNNTFWYVYSATLGATKNLYLNGAFGEATDNTAWNDTAPTSTQFTLGNGTATNGGSSSTYVNYLFATCAGVSKVGSYTGTATTKQIDCGFTAGARFVLIKRTDSTGDWYVWDTARGIVSGNDPYLLLNSTAAEVTSTDYIDTYSAGFEISSTAPAAINASGGSFIFLAIS